MRYLVDVMYPEAEYVNFVMDNLNTHHYHSLVETFGKTEADRIMNRLRFHFTPTHASWLNMAEVELSVLSGQCLSRRIADEWSLRLEIAAWENTRNILRPKFVGGSRPMMPVRFLSNITLHL